MTPAALSIYYCSYSILKNSYSIVYSVSINIMINILYVLNTIHCYVILLVDSSQYIYIYIYIYICVCIYTKTDLLDNGNPLFTLYVATLYAKNIRGTW